MVCFFFQRRRSVMGVWQNHWRLALQLLAVSTGLGSLQSVRGQCFGGVETYEKTSGTTVACDVPGTSCTSKGLLTQPDTSVTRDCIAICKQSAKCNSFTVGKNSSVTILLNKRLVRTKHRRPYFYYFPLSNIRPPSNSRPDGDLVRKKLRDQAEIRD